MDDRRVLTKEEAIAMLPDGDTIHTFRNPAGMLLGADWSRADVIKAIEQHEVELAGDTATQMKHGMVLHDGRGYLFIQTK